MTRDIPPSLVQVPPKQAYEKPQLEPIALYKQLTAQPIGSLGVFKILEDN